MNNVRTVSDTKRAFYAHHTRPINSIYRRVVEELMVEMHLLSVNVDFSYDPLYALGVVTAFDRFMQGYLPPQDRESIFQALCQSVERDPQQFRDDAEQFKQSVSELSIEDFKAQLQSLEAAPDHQPWHELRATAGNEKYKYSRLMAIGLYTLAETIAPDLVKDDKQRAELFTQVCTALNVSDDKVQKDLDLYRSNLEKVSQAQAVMKDILEAERKKRLQRDQAKAGATSAASEKDAPAEEPTQNPG
ncbi:MAG: photosystem II biogenesis protein Psp29 [Leptolyngbyaceae cyanobacterium SM1_1_3]|nr:photosystem II biogenesis protein Psp29 [Leptolyngbyaceae cyanobacterium SM1_1_3]NJN01388.1 photosystem II biogenesis protein Psp29 [Leptolyngbyaceae cyanobacterium RM1_1_2]NJO11148.1 photosystem II biogenesis protein Psp29 [Leptolyngbyaceae cyanobacterium SL_1_1]